MSKDDIWDDPEYIRASVIASSLVIHELLRIIGTRERSIYAELSTSLNRYIREADGRPQDKLVARRLRELQNFYHEFGRPD